MKWTVLLFDVQAVMCPDPDDIAHGSKFRIVDDYGSVVIWCELFGVLFSPAALTQAGESVDGA